MTLPAWNPEDQRADADAYAEAARWRRKHDQLATAHADLAESVAADRTKAWESGYLDGIAVGQRFQRAAQLMGAPNPDLINDAVGLVEDE